MGTERLWGPGYHANLVQQWIPALDGVAAKLEAGASVADIGCGHGLTTIIMGQAYPRSRVHRLRQPCPVDRARAPARGRGRRERAGDVRGLPRRPAYPGADYDLIAFFDCLHDMGDPLGALRYAREQAHAGRHGVAGGADGRPHGGGELQSESDARFRASRCCAAWPTGSPSAIVTRCSARWRRTAAYEVVAGRPGSAGCAARPRRRSTGCSSCDHKQQRLAYASRARGSMLCACVYAPSGEQTGSRGCLTQHLVRLLSL